jgi:phage-related protein
LLLKIPAYFSFARAACGTCIQNTWGYETAPGRQPAEEYILKLPRNDRMKIDEDIALIEKHGTDAPVTFRHINGKLWEIKTGQGKQQRIFYCLKTGPVMVLLHACKKTKAGEPKRRRFCCPIQIDALFALESR